MHHGPDDHAKREPFGPCELLDLYVSRDRRLNIPSMLSGDIGKLVHGAEKVEKAVKHKSKREPHDFCEFLNFRASLNAGLTPSIFLASRLPHLENGGHKPKPKRESADAREPSRPLDELGS